MLVLAMGVALAVLGAWNWVLRPDEPMRWLRGIFLVPVTLWAMALYARASIGAVSRRGLDDRAAILRYFDSTMVLVLAGGVPMLVRYGLGIWARFQPLDPAVGRRILALSIGVMFVIIGNVVPKVLTPLSMLPPGRSGRQQEARRFFGLVVVLLGLTIAAASLLGPLGLVAAAVWWAAVVGAVALVAAIVWMNAAPSQPEGQT